MNLFIKILSIVLLISTTCYAEDWVCFDPTTKYVTRTVHGDGYALGICSFNNTQIISTCILATKTEFDLAKQAYKKYDPSIVSGNRIISWTQAEIDAKVLTDTQAATTEKRNSAKNLYDNETFLKALAKVILDEFNRNRTWDGKPQITKQDVINAIKAEIDSGNSD